MVTLRVPQRRRQSRFSKRFLVVVSSDALANSAKRVNSGDAYVKDADTPFYLVANPVPARRGSRVRSRSRRRVIGLFFCPAVFENTKQLHPTCGVAKLFDAARAKKRATRNCGNYSAMPPRNSASS